VGVRHDRHPARLLAEVGLRTFESPRRTVQRTPDNSNCKLQTWAWGEFEMVTEVHFKNGDTVKLSHRLSFAPEVAAAKEAGASRFANE
jgi:hypothetical protein